MIAELGGGPNGAAIGPDGKCYVCNNGGFKWIERNGRLYPSEQPDDYRGGSIQRVDLKTGKFETLYTSCDGRKSVRPERHRVRSQWRILVHRPRQDACPRARPYRRLLRARRRQPHHRGDLSARGSQRNRPVARRRLNSMWPKRFPGGCGPTRLPPRPGRRRAAPVAGHHRFLHVRLAGGRCRGKCLRGNADQRRHFDPLPYRRADPIRLRFPIR